MPTARTSFRVFYLSDTLRALSKEKLQGVLRQNEGKGDNGRGAAQQTTTGTHFECVQCIEKKRPVALCPVFRGIPLTYLLMPIAPGGA